MTATWTRRDVLKTIAATASSPVLAHAAPPRRTVAIIGAGMAGVSVAWLLDGQRDVVLLESRDSIGGNVRTLDVELDGHHVRRRHGRAVFPSRTVSRLHRAAQVPQSVSTGRRGAAAVACVPGIDHDREPVRGDATIRLADHPHAPLANLRGLEPARPAGVLHRLQRRAARASRTMRAGRSRSATGCRHWVCRRRSGKASSCRGRRRCFRATSSRRAACPRARPCCSPRRRCPTI